MTFFLFHFAICIEHFVSFSKECVDVVVVAWVGARNAFHHSGYYATGFDLPDRCSRMDLSGIIGSAQHQFRIDWCVIKSYL
jgi:hypothetical protein